MIELPEGLEMSEYAEQIRSTEDFYPSRRLKVGLQQHAWLTAEIANTMNQLSTVSRLFYF